MTVVPISERNISLIPGYNVQREFNPLMDEADAALVDSMTAHGFRLDQPITVRKTRDGYELLKGYRRLEAARRAGIKTIPALIENHPIYVMDKETYDTLMAMQRRLHNRTNAMTFDEQRDFAERWRLFMARIERQEEV